MVLPAGFGYVSVSNDQAIAALSPATAPGNRDESISGGGGAAVHGVHGDGFLASEQCDGRQRADLASLPMTG